MLTQNQLKDALHYDPETGIFARLVTKGSRGAKGSAAGCFKKSTGYYLIGIDKKYYRAHRLAWLYVYGQFPNKCLDHINRVKTDNRISNLREVTDNENQHNRHEPNANNTSGFRGVSWEAERKRWVATIKVAGEPKRLGRFKTKEEAAQAYILAKRELHPSAPNI